MGTAAAFAGAAGQCQDLGGTTGWMDQWTDYAGVHRCTRTTRPHDLSGAGRRVGPMHGTSARLLADVRRGKGRVPFLLWIQRFF
jgi:hypothetical protein